MKRTARDKRDMPHPRPVERIELNEEHIGRRLAAAIVLLVFGGAMLAYAVWRLVTPETGWTTIEVEASAGVSCGGDFTFFYEATTTAERKAVTTHYTSLCRSAYEIFHSREEFEGRGNLWTVNSHPNEAVGVDPALYGALETIERSGSRLPYLGPVYDRYDDLFFCTDDSQTAAFDPRLNEEVAREYGEITAFANDPGAVRIELLGEDRVRLAVSPEYLAYAEREEIDQFIQLSWMTNAFIADYIAEELTALGYTKGTLSSYDGFTRNLDGSGREYAVSIYDRQGRNVYPAAVMSCRGPVSMVSFRDYPLNDQDMVRFYEMENGEIRTLYLDPADGLCRSAVHDLMCYAGDRGCGEILLQTAPVYIAGTLSAEALETLAAEGVQSIHCANGVICPTEAGITLTQLFERDGVKYTLAPQKRK